MVTRGWSLAVAVARRSLPTSNLIGLPPMTERCPFESHPPEIRPELALGLGSFLKAKGFLAVVCRIPCPFRWSDISLPRVRRHPELGHFRDLVFLFQAPGASLTAEGFPPVKGRG